MSVPLCAVTHCRAEAHKDSPFCSVVCAYHAFSSPACHPLGLRVGMPKRLSPPEDSEVSDAKTRTSPSEEKIDNLDNFPPEGIYGSDTAGGNFLAHLPHPSNQLRNVTSDARKRELLSATEKRVFPAGTILYHGGSDTLKVLDTKDGMLFLSLDPKRAQDYAKAGEPLYAFRLTRPVTLYRWYDEDMGLAYGVRLYEDDEGGTRQIVIVLNPWEHVSPELKVWSDIVDWLMESNRGHKVLRTNSYIVHDIMTQVGLDGRWHEIDDEVGLTPNAYDALERIVDE